MSVSSASSSSSSISSTSSTSVSGAAKKRGKSAAASASSVAPPMTPEVATAMGGCEQTAAVDGDRDEDYQNERGELSMSSSRRENAMYVSTATLDQKKTLVLDVAHRPISVINWKRALVMEMLAKAEVLEYYADVGIQSVNDVFPLPAVMKVAFYVKNMNGRRQAGHGYINVSRKSILIRDNYECQYCGSRSNLTIDHVIPSSRGGEWRYDNLVTACSKCNTKKGSKLPSECRMHPRKQPEVPKFFSVGVINSIAETVISGRAFPAEWEDYMPRPEMFF